MKILILFLGLIIVNLYAQSEKLEVSAKSFETDLKKGITELNGDVVITKGSDKLWADKVVIYSNQKNQPQKYTATGNVRFYAKLPDKEIKGRAKNAIYDVIKDEYQLIDSAVLEEIDKQNIVKGNLIIFNPSTQEASVKGSQKKPSTMSFIIENEQEQ